MPDYEIDYSDIAGRKVECPEGCGMCCLCQPEVLPEERGFFRVNHPDQLVKTRGPDSYFALAMKKGCGSCVFLKDGTRKCQIYDNRTAYCRQYPYHIHVSDRVKVELDLSCRGVWTGQGSDAMAEATAIVKAADKRIQSALKESKAVYRQFMANCREAGVLSDPSVLRMSVAENLTNFTDLGYLSGVLEAAELEAVMKLSMVKRPASPDMEELELAARESALESMNTTDPYNAPVYCDPEFKWNVFLYSDGMVHWNILTDAGDLIEVGRAAAEDIHLKPLDPDGVKPLADYIAVLNGRDSFMGSVFHLMDCNEYDDDMSNAYYACMATTVLDLMWRASMLDHFTGCGMGAEGIREAVIFYDMDRLDAPTIGGFV